MLIDALLPAIRDFWMKGRVAHQGIRGKKDRATQTLFPHEQVQTLGEPYASALLTG